MISPGLISLVQMGVLEIHPWGSREDRIDRPDRLIFDIDPGEDLAWGDVVRAARHVRERLEDLGLDSFVRTTGGKGLHVVAPLVRRASWDELKALLKAFADALVREQPKRYIAQASKAKRAGKLYIDYLRNEKGATAIASYSTRARPGATVATPLSWDELSASLRPDRFNYGRCPGGSSHEARCLAGLFRCSPNDYEGDAGAGRAVVKTSSGTFTARRCSVARAISPVDRIPKRLIP